jgi:hypothetical protein
MDIIDFINVSDFTSVGGRDNSIYAKHPEEQKKEEIPMDLFD